MLAGRFRVLGAAAVLALCVAVLAPASPAAALGGPSGGFSLPAGEVVTLSGVTFGACNSLTWGYEVGGGARHDEASNFYGCSTQSAPNVTVGPNVATTGLDVALPLAGTVTGVISDSVTAAPVTGICAYAIDTTANILRGYSTGSTSGGLYTISGLPPGTDKIAFQPCSSALYLISYSSPLTVVGGGTVTQNQVLGQS